jgi:hypothetical protein
MWCILILFSAAVFLITGNPLIAATLPYLVAAEPSIQSGFWIRFRDPIGSRGKICFWFYLATAGWTAASTAFLHVFLFICIERVTGIGPNMDEFGRTLIVLLVGLGISTLLGVIGVIFAFQRRVRVFVVPNLFSLCRGDFDSVSAATRRRPRFNHAIFILASSIFVPILGVGLAMSILGVTGHEPASISPLQCAGLATIMIGPLAAIPLYGFCSNRIIARNPLECWSPAVFTI